MYPVAGYGNIILKKILDKHFYLLYGFYMKTMETYLEFIYYPLWRFANKLLDIPKEIKWFIQRGKRGYSDRDCWSFDTYLAGVISGGLTKLNENHNLRYDIKSNKWVFNGEPYKQIIEGFTAYHKKEQPCGAKEYKNLQRKLNESLKLFSKHFEEFWD